MDGVRFVRWGALSSLVALAACGGAGSGDGAGGGFSNALFAGSYGASITGGRDGPPDTHVFLSGVFTPDGAGTAGASLALRNLDGVVDAPGPLEPSPYAVAADGAVSMGALTGGITASGDALLAASVEPGSLPYVYAALRHGFGLRNATLAGTYAFAILQHESASAALTGVGTLVLDGAGAVTGGTVAAVNLGGVVFTPVLAVAGTYAVASDGSATLAVPGVVGSLRGTAHAGGDVAIFGGDTVSGEPPRVAVLVRQGTTASAATLAGDHWIVGLRLDAPTFRAYTCFRGTVRADGVGTLSYLSVTENTEGAVSTPGGLDDYAVQADGTFLTSDTAGVGGGPFRRGAVTADGRFAFLSGEVVAGSPPILFLLARKN